MIDTLWQTAAPLITTSTSVTDTYTLSNALETQPDGTVKASSERAKRGVTTSIAVPAATSTTISLIPHEDNVNKTHNALTYVEQLSDDELQEMTAKLEGKEVEFDLNFDELANTTSKSI